ncbi:hypothetical protein F3Y22_tig00111027pilonHSYRG00479 [Hibiscus syriacus]|uniref:Glutathione S-transferase n=1 Tax=Hibiscus syriacus TaxID=106335 RepID=A0A6A2Z627_HIBSY|nr:hypothetical protein F3Y22_tig00111027pilonHSYRG00479 [Hibiscus syriacus]
MATSEVKDLGTWGSPFVRRPRIALNIKCVKHEYIKEKKLFEAKSELLLRSNPVHKRAADYFTDEIMFSDRDLKPTREFQSSSMEIMSQSANLSLSYNTSTRLGLPWCPAMKSIVTHGEEVEEAAVAQLKEGLTLMEEAFGKQREGFLWAIEMLNGMKLLDESNTPALVNWADRFCSHAAVKNVMPHTHKLAKLAKMVLRKVFLSKI